jgi:hypothetical protein
MQYEPSWDEIIAYPFDVICRYFKVTNRYPQLLEWFNKQKDRFIREFIEDENDVEHVLNLIKNIQNNQNISDISSYINTRNRYLTGRYFNDEDIENMFSDPKIVLLIKLFKQILKVMEEDNQYQNTANAYTSSTISRSRYTYDYLNNTNCTNSTVHNPPVLSANFTEPLKWYNQYKRLYNSNNSKQIDCSICLENSIPFILLRKTFILNKVYDFIDNPLDYYYPQLLCGKCAGYFCSMGIDPVRVSCCAAIPIIHLTDDLKPIFYKNFASITDINYNDQFNNSQTNSLAQPNILTHFLPKFIASHIYKYPGDKNDVANNIYYIITLFSGFLRKQFNESPDFIDILNIFDECFNYF